MGQLWGLWGEMLLLDSKEEASQCVNTMQTQQGFLQVLQKHSKYQYVATAIISFLEML